MRKDLDFIRWKVNKLYQLRHRLGQKFVNRCLKLGWAAYEAKFNETHPAKVWYNYETHGDRDCLSDAGNLYAQANKAISLELKTWLDRPYAGTPKAFVDRFNLSPETTQHVDDMICSIDFHQGSKKAQARIKEWLSGERSL